MATTVLRIWSLQSDHRLFKNRGVESTRYRICLLFGGLDWQFWLDWGKERERHFKGVPRHRATRLDATSPIPVSGFQHDIQCL